VTLHKIKPSNPIDPLEPKPVQQQATFLHYVAAIVLFVAFSAAAVWIMIRLRANFIQIITFFQIDKDVLLGTTNLGTFILMALVLVGVAWMQHDLFKGMQGGMLWKRALRIFIVELILTALSMAFTIIMRLFVL
jgi:hypothetical protein